MSKLICSSAIEGAIAWVARAEAKLDEAVAAKGESCAVGFPDTAYFLPVIYSFTGEKMQTLAELGYIEKERLANGHLKHLVNVLTFIEDFQNAALVSGSLAVLADQFDIREKLHFDRYRSIPLARFAAACLEVE